MAELIKYLKKLASHVAVVQLDLETGGFTYVMHQAVELRFSTDLVPTAMVGNDLLRRWIDIRDQSDSNARCRAHPGVRRNP